MALLSTVSRSNWNLEMLVFVEGGKPEYPEKNPRIRDENQQQTQIISTEHPQTFPHRIFCFNFAQKRLVQFSPKCEKVDQSKLGTIMRFLLQERLRSSVSLVEVRVCSCVHGYRWKLCSSM